MISQPLHHYPPFPQIDLPNRQWPSRSLNAPPIWCSVDLRDGNQALAVPMTVAQKLEMFEALVQIGFKQIEVGFPSASNTEFDFIRRLIDENRVPEDVTLQVLVQAREDLIERTVQSLVGAKNVIIHLYNSTSPAQRKVVFGLDQPAIVQVAVQGATWIKERLHYLADSEVTLQYSPESFSATELTFSLEICHAVMAVWQPTPEHKIILNLPDTVEVAMCNVYADQIEWFIRHLDNRESVIISVHTHNDRGTGVAATELALLAGAERVEGTLFGNGERTGNLDIVIVALNFYSQGIHPGLDLSNMPKIREMYEHCTGMTVPPRQPYGGDLVFTAFSGSHQDAIKKGFAYMKEAPLGTPWTVPYLVINPSDLGREYKEVIRVNSQSGKGGIAYLLESDYSLILPKEMQREFGPIANDQVDRLGREVSAAELKDMFWKEYVERNAPYQLVHFHADGTGGQIACRATVNHHGKEWKIIGAGNGPIAAFVDGLIKCGAPEFAVRAYSEHSLGTGTEANAIAYIQIKTQTGHTKFGAGTDTNIELASIKAILSALNRLD
ncbi:MAG: 2-isopropylmalate synthase [Blastochloris sp.]|nr:2-isopropylmalate synthase [Blastochloris sp.]